MDVLQATAETGRCYNPFFRQEQLKSLHDILRNNVNEIKKSLIRDAGITDFEATTEVAAALLLVRQHYDSIDSAKELDLEYLIAKGKNAVDRREPYGVVYIDADLSHTPFFSIIAPLSAGLVAGNCIALKLENTLRALPSLLRTLLPQALSFDTFTILSSDPLPEALKNCVQVIQDSDIDNPSYLQVVSQKRRVIAVVDRTADLNTAAESLVTARFAYSGASPYAPDLVLVNEFVKKEFLELVLRQAIRFLAGSTDVMANGYAAKKETTNSNLNQALQKLSEDLKSKLNTITRGERGAVVEASTPLNTHLPLPSKIAAPIFCISAITSLDHAIDLVSASASSGTKFLAAYHFASPAHAKYLGQFVKSHATFVNHIPSQMLLGPAAPVFSPIEIEGRYSPDQFTQASPQFIDQIRTPVTVSTTGKGDAKKAAHALQNAAKEINVAKRAEGVGPGFFEQGIFIGLGMYGVPLLTCLGASVYFLARTAVRRFS